MIRVMNKSGVEVVVEAEEKEGELLIRLEHPDRIVEWQISYEEWNAIVELATPFAEAHHFQTALKTSPVWFQNFVRLIQP